ncbi:hypothetical protein BZU93_28760, partial [Salmonella enterica subsp. enterica]|nr:hypothetical protein [Salmonella enterica subsp. enterica serovar Enteritidis]
MANGPAINVPWERIGLGRRTLGGVIDYAVIGLLIALSGRLAPVYARPETPWFWFAVTVFALVYFVVLETACGTTIGKALAGVRTIDLSDSDRYGLPFGKAMARETVKIFGAIPLVIVLAFGDANPASSSEALAPLPRLLA